MNANTQMGCFVFRASYLDLIMATLPGPKWGILTKKNFQKKIRKHEESSWHINCAINLSHLGQAIIAVALNTGHALSVARHNGSVQKNPFIENYQLFKILW